jgi:hypothetical protein
MPLTTFQKDVLAVIASNRSAESHFAGGLVLNATDDSACGKDEGFSPRFLLGMMRRFAKINPAKVSKIQAREIDQKTLKLAWIEMSDFTEQEISRLADSQPDMPIGVAFVNKSGKPGWIGQDPTLLIHRPSIRGCLPVVHVDTEE